MGDRDLAVPVRAAGTSVTMVARRDSVSRFSRHVDAWMEDTRPDEERLVGELLTAAAAADGPAVLFYQLDDHLLFVSRHRERLARGLRFVIPPADLVERLVDKSAFDALASTLDLPVPQSWVVPVGVGQHPPDLPLPVVIKPLRRVDAWGESHASKAVLVRRRSELEELFRRLAGRHDRVIAQALIPGPESRIESYHVHVDAAGRIRCEFTGRKLRTYPAAMGHSSALLTTTAPDVTALGREVVGRLDFRGVAKLDFKRDDSGRLWLLEVNPRFNLWHHLGAAAGVNIPASVLAEVLDLPHPPSGPARPGATWCRLARDWRAARSEGISPAAWGAWALRTDARSTVDLLDPMPMVARGVLTARRVRAKRKPA
jgi:predicted ATP-grasp superfamily ATP-dependent carboligase